MELTMNMGAFEQLDNREMMGVDGGISWNDIGLYVAGAAGAAIGVYVAGAKFGAAVGTAANPGIGTVVGGIVGGAIGVAIYTLWD